MNSVAPSGGEGQIDIINLMGEAQKANNDSKKDVRVMRQSAHMEKMTALDKNINSMKDQKAQMQSHSMFNFVVGMFSNFLSMVTQALSFAIPAAAPVVNLVGGLFQNVMNTVSQYVNGDSASEQQQFQIDQQKFMKMAEEAQNRYAMEDEFYKGMEQSANTVDQRLEASLQNVMKSQEAAVRV